MKVKDIPLASLPFSGFIPPSQRHNLLNQDKITWKKF
jgi:hypothetical protein